MAGRKCKISLFCVQFLVSYFIGTICGVLLFRFGTVAQSDWLLTYGQVISSMVQTQTPFDLVRLLRPLAIAGLLVLVPWKKSALLLVVVARGCLTAYSVCLFYGSGQSCLYLVFRGLILLPLFFLVCYETWRAGYAV